ncbi:MAG TPA: radical SAM protein [bacterium]|nr:radical SAM protein [bacterium]
MTYKEKIVLISPPEQSVLMEAGDRPSLGILYVAGALRKAGHDVVLSDLNHDSYYTLERKIDKIKPDFIGMTTMSAYYGWFSEYAKHLRHRFPESKLIAGGPHATILPETIENIFDFVVQGEGEHAIVDIVEGRAERGLVRRPYEENLDNLAKPARDLLPLDKRYQMSVFGKRATTLIGTRSCPYSCFFCTKDILGPKQRKHSVDYTLDEMEELTDKFGFQSLYFQDDCFTHDRERTMNLAQGILDRGMNLEYKVITRSDKVDREMLELMKESGLNCLSLGFEHMDDKVLEGTGKGSTVGDNIEAARMCKDLGLKVKGNFILNLPGATKETMYQCLDFAKSQNMDLAMFYSLIAYPGTKLWDNPDKYGMRITDYDYGVHQCSDCTNIEMVDIPTARFKGIANDIRNKWKEFKGSGVPWES